MGMGGGGLGWEAQARVWRSLLGFRPARARVWIGEEGVVVLRNLRASRRTYLPVKPEAPRIIRSNFESGFEGSSMVCVGFWINGGFCEGERRSVWVLVRVKVEVEEDDVP